MNRPYGLWPAWVFASARTLGLAGPSGSLYAIVGALNVKQT